LPVRRLTQSGDGVDAVTDAQTIGGRFAIVTAPPMLAGRIEYEPPVSVGRDQVTQRFAMGAAVKVLVTYERAFWREAGFSGEVVSSDGPLSVVYDNTSHDGRQPALVGLVVGSQARQWSSDSSSAAKRGNGRRNLCPTDNTAWRARSSVTSAKRQARFKSIASSIGAQSPGHAGAPWADCHPAF
ncbi:MAG: FAD-dependent oxidoreductase, partial [Deltaproteobacteria bacterium]|nr:FAD-dependent oxidoreductase [Deltaproteobacteria bacterium]